MMAAIAQKATWLMAKISGIALMGTPILFRI